MGCELGKWRQNVDMRTIHGDYVGKMLLWRQYMGIMWGKHWFLAHILPTFSLSRIKKPAPIEAFFSRSEDREVFELTPRRRSHKYRVSRSPCEFWHPTYLWHGNGRGMKRGMKMNPHLPLLAVADGRSAAKFINGWCSWFPKCVLHCLVIIRGVKRDDSTIPFALDMCATILRLFQICL